VLPGKDLEKVASLPTREQALSMLLGTLKAPIEKFVRTVAAPHTKLVRTVAAVRDAKQAAGA
jgi:large subunit ribosomal protein L10